MSIEPFGYFKAEPFGWTDCAETDEGAVKLYDQAAIDELVKQRDELLAAAKKYIGAIDSWDGSAKAERYTKHRESDLRDAIDSVKGGV